MQQWEKCLGEGSKKRTLTIFLSTEWKQDKYKEKLGGEVLYVTCKEHCHKISAEEIPFVDELKSTQEEELCKVSQSTSRITYFLRP